MESSAICSYCFAKVSEGFRCSDCTRIIHKSCFLDYKSFAPWSYSCPGSQFSVCIDCWIPKSLARNRLLKRKRNAKKGRKVVCALRCDRVEEVGDITKPLQTAENGSGSLRDRKKGSSSFGDSKNDGCTRSSNKVVKQNVLLVTNSLGAKGNEMAAQECDEMVVDNVVDDAELAFRLHRSMNSSPRISKKLRLEKMSFMVYNRRMKKCAVNASIGASYSGNVSVSRTILACSCEGSHDSLDRNNSENHMASCHDSSTDVHLTEANRVADQGSGQEDFACLIKCSEEEENLRIEIKEGKGSSLNGMGPEFLACSKYHDSMKLMDVGNVGKKVQNLVTYCKKRLSSDKDNRCKNLYDKIHFENTLSPL